MKPKAKILIADDEPDAVDLIAYNLVENGYEVFTADNGLEALQKVQRFQPDVVLLDIMMQGLDGYAVCEILRRLPSTTGTGIIMLTALVGQAPRARGIASGADDYVTKPFSPQDLVRRVAAVLRARENRKLQTEAATDRAQLEEVFLARALSRE
jgi:two-component system, OmpR family, alkaline phosphatase synthesis response regulator PhoP